MRIISVLTVLPTMVLFCPTFTHAQGYQTYRSSVIFIETETRRDHERSKLITGTGFVISDDGYIITAGHILPEEPGSQNVYKARIGSRGGPQYDLVLVKADRFVDVALARIVDLATALAPVKIRVRGNDVLGAKVYTLGFPGSAPLSSYEGIVSSVAGHKGYWQTTLPLEPGSSGGPVFDQTGFVVGLAIGGINTAVQRSGVVPASYFLSLVKMVPLPVPDAQSNPPSVQFSRPPSHQFSNAPSHQFRVTGVVENDVLNVRTQPNADAPLAAKLGPTARGLTKLECYPNGWCHVAQYGRELGFVSSRYLVEDNLPDVNAPCDAIAQETQGRFSVVGVNRDDTLKIRRDREVQLNNIVSEIPAHATNVVVGTCAQGWCLVRYDGVCGFVASKFLAHGETGRAPVVADR